MARPWSVTPLITKPKQTAKFNAKFNEYPIMPMGAKKTLKKH
jgi:hypothetical protein